MRLRVLLRLFSTLNFEFEFKLRMVAAVTSAARSWRHHGADGHHPRRTTTMLSATTPSPSSAAALEDQRVPCRTSSSDPGAWFRDLPVRTAPLHCQKKNNTTKRGGGHAKPFEYGALALSCYLFRPSPNLVINVLSLSCCFSIHRLLAHVSRSAVTE
jgi:hypothetical protein